MPCVTGREKACSTGAGDLSLFRSHWPRESVWLDNRDSANNREQYHSAWHCYQQHRKPSCSNNAVGGKERKQGERAILIGHTENIILHPGRGEHQHKNNSEQELYHLQSPLNVTLILFFQPPSWEDDTDEFLKSMLTGSDLSGLGVSGSDTVCPSDTSSDSGCPEEQVHYRRF